MLAEEGAPALRIDRVSQRVGLSKGSFFHHFASATAYHAAVLDAWETEALASAPHERAGESLHAQAGRVEELVDVALERAIRAWGMQNPTVGDAVRRVDAARLAALEAAWSRLVEDPEVARTAALLPHLLVIGASMTEPPTSSKDLQGVMEMLATFIPVVARESSATDRSTSG